MANEDFRRVLETLRLAIAGVDGDGSIAFANAAFTELAGDAAGEPLAARFAPQDQARVRQNLSRVAQGKAATAFLEARLGRGGDEAPWVSVSFQPWPDEGGKPRGAVVVLRDIAAERRTEEALNLAGARLLALAEASPAAKMIETAEGDIELANEAFCRVLAIDSAPQSLAGLAVEAVLARSPCVEAKAVARMRRQEGVSSVELLRPDGVRTSLERHPVSADGVPAGAIWTSREEKAAAAEKGAAEVALIERIAQELSVALEGLGTLSIRAQRSELDAALVEHYRRIRGATEAAMAGIADLVDFSRLSGAVELKHRAFGLRAALAELVSRVIPEFEERGVGLRMKVEQDVADALEGDVERLLLVLKNLLEAALAMSPGGEVKLQIIPEYVTESGIQLSFSVSAAAPGAGESLPRAAPDGGMGVAVAKFMVAAMGGKLVTAARAGAEALYSFTIGFPVRPPAPPPPRPTFATLVGIPVLLVSAHPEQRDALASVLRGWRMLPLEADNASMAMTLLERLHQESTPVPLVILSNRLPVQDGFLLAFRIKHHPRFAPTLVMMLASDGRPGDAIACRENGVSAYMRYPIGDHQLHEAIMAVTGAAAAADEAPTLVTRHSLRETRKGATVLLVDRSRDSQIRAAHILGREDCSVVVAHDAEEASSALEQDAYDIVLVDTATPGIAPQDAAARLRARAGREGEGTLIVAVVEEPSAAHREAALARGFDAAVAKPFRKEELLQLLARVERLTAAQ